MLKSWSQPSLVALLLISLASCGQGQERKSASHANETTAAVPSSVAAGSEAVAETNSACRSSLIFVAATVYAGATDYYFKAPDNSEVVFRVENGATRAQGFEELIESGDEGPPDTNPDMVGKKFKVCETDGAMSALSVD